MRGRAEPEPFDTTASDGAAPVVLVGSDGSAGAERAVEVAGRLAASVGARIVVAHVQPLVTAVPSAEFVDRLRDDLELAVVVQASRVLDPAGVPWQLALTTGDAAHGLSQLADEHHASVVVVGTRGSGAGHAVRRIVSGSVSSHLVHHEHRPVLVVPMTSA